MKFRVERDLLADAVSWAARTLPTRPSMPVLAGLLLDAADDHVSLSSFDYEVSARVTIDAAVEEAGRVLVPGRLVAEIARSLPSAPVVLADEAARVQVTCGRASFSVPKLPVEDYPALPAMPDAAGSVDAAEFASAVAQVAIAAGRDDTLPTLTGMRVEIDGSRVVLAATDRYRLAVREFDWQPGKGSVSAALLIPARTIADAAKSFAGSEQVRIALPAGGEGLAGFEAGGRRMTTRLLDGDFPKYRTLLPTEASTTADVETAALGDAVKRVALVAERNTPVRLSFSDGEVLLRAGAGDDASATEGLEASLQGDSIEIAFNPGYLLEGLGAMSAPITRFSFTHPSKPAVLFGVAETGGTADKDYQYLLMPVRLTG